MKDRRGRNMAPQNLPQPRWTIDDMGKAKAAGYRILEYKGFFRKTPNSKGNHWYKVQCMNCGKEYERIQGALVKNIKRGCLGCHQCAKDRYHADEKAQRELRAKKELERLQKWLWVLFTMPVTSIRTRCEQNKCFDSEYTVIRGWRTI